MNGREAVVVQVREVVEVEVLVVVVGLKEVGRR